MSNDGVDVWMSDGRLFHARGPATANARSPMVERYTLSMHNILTWSFIVTEILQLAFELGTFYLTAN